MNVFVSYSRQDAAFVERLGQDLSTLGYDVWVDMQDIVGSGEDRWRRSIVKAIRDCDAVVLVLSPNSTQSENVERELSVAADNGKRLIPVLYRECLLPDGFQYELAGLQYIDFTTLEFMDGVRQLTAQLGPTRTSAIEGGPSNAEPPVQPIHASPGPGLPNRWRQPRVLIAAGVGLVVLLVVAVALAGGRGDGSTTPTHTPTTDLSTARTTQEPPSEPSISVTITPPASTTTVIASVEPTADELVIAQALLRQLAHQSSWLDYSKPSSGPCGTFGLIVLVDRIEFYQWSGGTWADASSLLVANGDTPPITVTSSDYTGDGVIDFLVSYDGTASGGRQFGGVLFVHDCTWGWADILTIGGDVTKGIDALSYDTASGELIAEDFLPEVGLVPITLSYNRDDNRFVAERSP
jgi:hypothetical protein